MSVVNIDGSALRSLDDLHDQIAAHPDTPDFYGRNLDALGDVLTGFFQPPLDIRVCHAEAARLSMGADFEKMMSVLQDACRETEGSTLSVSAGPPPSVGEDR